MKTEELKQQYDEITSRIASARMYDGRNSGVDVYVCDKCGYKFYTRYKDKGVTPFTIKCRNCGHGTAAHRDTISEQIANVMGFKVQNWVRPTFKQLQNLSDGMIEHVLDGGLMLEDELNHGKTKDKNYERAQLLYNLLQTICEAADGVEEMETDAGITRILSFRYEPTIEFFEDDVRVIKELINEMGEEPLPYITEEG